MPARMSERGYQRGKNDGFLNEIEGGIVFCKTSGALGLKNEQQAAGFRVNLIHDGEAFAGIDNGEGVLPLVVPLQIDGGG